MGRFNVIKLPKDVLHKISNIEWNDGDFGEEVIGQVNLNDEWTFEDGSHINIFTSRKDLIDLVRDARFSSHSHGQNERKLKFYLMTLWESLSLIVGEDQTDKNIDEENSIVEELDRMLPFKDEHEHDHWLNVLQSYKCWEDFEELTLKIIRRLK